MAEAFAWGLLAGSSLRSCSGRQRGSLSAATEPTRTLSGETPMHPPMLLRPESAPHIHSSPTPTKASARRSFLRYRCQGLRAVHDGLNQAFTSATTSIRWPSKPTRSRRERRGGRWRIRSRTRLAKGSRPPILFLTRLHDGPATGIPSPGPAFEPQRGLPRGEKVDWDFARGGRACDQPRL
jgi:hypothetical protein